MADLVFLILLIVASTLTYLLVLGCERLMEKRS
jgi:hypothetical protein